MLPFFFNHTWVCFSFQRAKLLHKTLKDREKLRKKAKVDHKNDQRSSLSTPFIKKTDPSFGSQLLQPQTMRALEKNIKKKAGKFAFSEIFRGNVLHVSVNDSDSTESSCDSLDEF